MYFVGTSSKKHFFAITNVLCIQFIAINFVTDQHRDKVSSFHVMLNDNTKGNQETFDLDV